MDKKITKENFLRIISKLSIEDVNRIISEKGKKPKAIVPIYVFDEDDKK